MLKLLPSASHIYTTRIDETLLSIPESVLVYHCVKTDFKHATILYSHVKSSIAATEVSVDHINNVKKTEYYTIL